MVTAYGIGSQMARVPMAPCQERKHALDIRHEENQVLGADVLNWPVMHLYDNSHHIIICT
jgi:hypothetical protein